MRHYASSSAQENQARHKKPVSDGFYDCKALSRSFALIGLAGGRRDDSFTHSGSFLGLPYRILYMNPKKELLWSL